MRKYQYYDTGDDGDVDAYGVNWLAQTFTPEAVHMISKVKLKLFRVGDPGTVKVSIKNTTAGKPSGADLCSGTIEGINITEDTNGEWYEITLGSGYTFEKNKMYAIVVRAPDGDASNKVSWRRDTGDATYPGGTLCTSSDSGVDWGIISGSDCMFEEWGVGEPAPTAVVWGLLPKSQIDSELIEEAIARMIAEHNEDETAHLGEGQSLQSHKASEIIDHVVNSIIADKIRNREIPIEKLTDFNYLRYSFSLETLDCWDTSSGVFIYGGRMGLSTGGAINTVCYADSKNYIRTIATKFFKAQMVFRLGYTTKQLAYIVVGSDSIDGDEQQNCGFKIVDNKIYALHSRTNGVTTTEYTTEIETLEADKIYIGRVVFYPGEKIEFYLNDVLKATHTENLFNPDFNEQDLFHLYIKNTEALNKNLSIEQLYIAIER